MKSLFKLIYIIFRAFIMLCGLVVFLLSFTAIPARDFINLFIGIIWGIVFMIPYERINSKFHLLVYFIMVVFYVVSGMGRYSTDIVGLLILTIMILNLLNILRFYTKVRG